MPSHIQNTASTPLLLSAHTFTQITRPKAAQLGRWLVRRLNPAVLRRQEQLRAQNSSLRKQLRETAQRLENINALNREADTQAQAAQAEVDRLTADNDRLHQELAAQNQSIEDILRHASAEETARLALAAEKDALEQQNEAMTQELDRLRALAGPEHCVAWTPTQLTQIPGWIEQYWPRRVTFSNRALRELAESDYQKVELAAQAARLLANEYYKWRKGGLGVTTDDFFTVCAQNRLTFSRTPRNLGKSQREKYIITYKDKPRLMEHQLKSKNSWDSRETLRIYFLWDRQTARVVIGNMPGHLPNRIR